MKTLTPLQLVGIALVLPGVATSLLGYKALGFAVTAIFISSLFSGSIAAVVIVYVSQLASVAILARSVVPVK